jgi:hypothetical protein
MNRFGGITETLSRLLDQAGVVLPPWVFPAVITLGFLALLPLIRRNSRMHRARRLVQDIASERDLDRPEQKAQAIELVQDHPDGLVGLADEAVRRGVNDLAMSALEELKKHGRPAMDIHRLQIELHGPPPAHLEGELAAIESLLSHHLIAAAEKRLRKAEQTWPDAPELRRLALRCHEE